ncbi:MAG: hypothetical protein M1818_004160 [Claussenomyces sp. TS43310]|nr:MAG: hypothetical protein M1818_004160 [Claussenomyces sp. TS43310]
MSYSTPVKKHRPTLSRETTSSEILRSPYSPEPLRIPSSSNNTTPCKDTDADVNAVSSPGSTCSPHTSAGSRTTQSSTLSSQHTWPRSGWYTGSTETKRTTPEALEYSPESVAIGWDRFIAGPCDGKAKSADKGMVYVTTLPDNDHDDETANCRHDSSNTAAAALRDSLARSKRALAKLIKRDSNNTSSPGSNKTKKEKLTVEAIRAAHFAHFNSLQQARLERALLLAQPQNTSTTPLLPGYIPPPTRPSPQIPQSPPKFSSSDNDHNGYNTAATTKRPRPLLPCLDETLPATHDYIAAHRAAALARLVSSDGGGDGDEEDDEEERLHRELFLREVLHLTGPSAPRRV